MQRTMLPHHPQHSWLKDILFLSFVLGGLFFIFLGVRPLFVPDEGRYAEIAREMVARGDYVTPYLNGIKYFEKPILFYWLESAAIQLGGLNLWSIRSVNALLALLGCLLTYCTARTLYNRTVGLFAAFILGTSTLYFVMAHMISLDLPVTIFLTITLYAFLLGVQHPPSRTRRFYLWGASVAAACAVLTKGLIGIVFPFLIVITWIAFLGEWRLLLNLYLPSCAAIFFLIAAPWHLWVGYRNPEFFYFYFIKQHFLRYTSMKIGHYQPAWFFLPTLVIGFFPWIVFVPQALLKSWRERRTNQLDLFFLIWALLIFVFFSFSKSKLIPYILPVFPPLAILTARYLQQALFIRGMKIGLICLTILATIIAVTLYLFPRHAALPNPASATLYLSLAASVLMAGVLAACFYSYRSIYKGVTILIATAWIFNLLLLHSIPAIETRTIKPLADQLSLMLTPEDEVVTYNQYFQDLPFYLQRRITILNWKNELRFGMQHQDTQLWMIGYDVFWQRWNSEKRLFAIMGKKEYQNFAVEYANQKFYLIGQTNTNVLISNRPAPKQPMVST